jgi:hypothetical protein
MTPIPWFLDADERGNPATAIDRRHGDIAWTDGNLVDILVDGKEYFAQVHEALASTGAGDLVCFSGLEGHADQRLTDTESSEIGRVLCAAAERGVDVRGLVWRSHALLYNEAANLLFTRAVNDAGGQVLLDQRIRRWGSHHQKIVIVIRAPGSPYEDIAAGRRSLGGELRSVAAVARRADPGPGSRGGRRGVHVPGALGRSEPPRHTQPVAGRAAPIREATRAAAAASSGDGAGPPAGIVCGASAPDVPGAAQGLSVRAAG